MPMPRCQFYRAKATVGLHKDKPMASKTNKKLPQPWHTASFHRARLAGVLSYVMVASVTAIIRGDFHITIFFLSMLAMVDVATIIDWKNGKVVTSPILAYGAYGSKDQQQHLAMTVGGFCFAMLCAMYVVGRGIVNGTVNPVLVVTGVIGINLYGWFLLPWLREIIPMIKQYYLPSSASSTTSTPMNTATPTDPQTHSQRLLAGSGIRP